MTKEQLQANDWKIEQHFHNEEAYYYFTATKGRDILTSHDGQVFKGQLNGVWV
jgi:hypothetical protein